MRARYQSNSNSSNLNNNLKAAIRASLENNAKLVSALQTLNLNLRRTNSQVIPKNMFRVKNVRGDGNCLFRAIEVARSGGLQNTNAQLNKLENTYSTLRSQVITMELNNLRHRNNFQKENLNVLVELTERNNAWGGHQEALTASLIYGRPIVILEPRAGDDQNYYVRWTSGGYNRLTNQNMQRAIYILRVSRVHYNALIPLNRGALKAV